MKLTTICTILSIALTASAAPGHHREHHHRPQPPSVNQVNICGNGVEPYCCTSSKGGDTKCEAVGQSGICDSTTVCCNANESVEFCVGNINIINFD